MFKRAKLKMRYWKLLFIFSVIGPFMDARFRAGLMIDLKFMHEELYPEQYWHVVLKLL